MAFSLPFLPAGLAARRRSPMTVTSLVMVQPAEAAASGRAFVRGWKGDLAYTGSTRHQPAGAGRCPVEAAGGRRG